LGALAWLAMLKSGVHATVSGVLLGFLTPTRAVVRPGFVLERAREALDNLRELFHMEEREMEQGGHQQRAKLVQDVRQVSLGTLSPLDNLSRHLEPFVAYFVMPVFALANAGVRFEAATLSDVLAQRVGLAVGLGLVLGKPIGIALFSYAACRFRIAALPAGVAWNQIWATGLLAGIGFTVALFVTNLAFEEAVLIDGAKLGILIGSLVATLGGACCLAKVLPRECRDGRP